MGVLYRKVVKGNSIFLAPIEYVILYELLFSILIGQGSYQSSKDSISGYKVWLLFKRVNPATGDGIQEESSAIFRTLYEAGITNNVRRMFNQGWATSFVKEMFKFPGVREQFSGLSTPNASSSNTFISSSHRQDGATKAIGLKQVDVFFIVLFIGLLAATLVFVFQVFVLHKETLCPRVFYWYRNLVYETKICLRSQKYINDSS
jgi:hypothetical protein